MYKNSTKNQTKIKQPPLHYYLERSCRGVRWPIETWEWSAFYTTSMDTCGSSGDLLGVVRQRDERGERPGLLLRARRMLRRGFENHGQVTHLRSMPVSLPLSIIREIAFFI